LLYPLPAQGAHAAKLAVGSSAAHWLACVVQGPLSSVTLHVLFSGPSESPKKHAPAKGHQVLPYPEYAQDVHVVKVVVGCNAPH
jgi:hypothetical protein